MIYFTHFNSHPKRRKKTSLFQLSSPDNQCRLNSYTTDTSTQIQWHPSLETVANLYRSQGSRHNKKKPAHSCLFTHVLWATSLDNSTSSNEHLPIFLKESTLGWNMQLSKFTQSFWEKRIWGFITVSNRLIYPASTADIKGSRSEGWAEISYHPYCFT